MVVLRVDGSFVSLVSERDGFDRRRTLDVAPLRDITNLYRSACDRRLSNREESTFANLGRELYRWLDGDEGWLEELLGGLVPPFLFEVQASKSQPNEVISALLQAPWELLADSRGFLAADTLLRFAPVRRIGKPGETHLDGFRLGVAFMASSPRDTDELNYEAEEMAILNAAPQGIDLFVEDSGDPLQLSRQLAEQSKSPYHVLHLSCHGTNAWKRSDDAKPEPALIMEDDKGNERPTPAAELIDMLGPTKPRLLFLSACLTAAAAEAGASGPVTDSLATTLVRAGLPAVLGWDGSVVDGAATNFAHELYERLAKGWAIAEAAAAARRHLLQGSLGAPDYDKGTEAAMLRRDWHLARVWLGAAPVGGAVAGGKSARSSLQPFHGHKRVLEQKSDAQLEVASPAMFVGRRRELQRALRACSDEKYAGVLLHGMGRLGKSSLAARIADRRPDLRLAVVFGAYDALSVLDALDGALAENIEARQLVASRRALVRDDPDGLQGLLVDLLAGPCADRPILLLIDDLERILEPGPREAVRRVRAEERPVMRAIFRAFKTSRRQSRLIVTSRFPFSLQDGDTNLSRLLAPIQLAAFSEQARRKLSARQAGAARSDTTGRTSLSEGEIVARMDLLGRAQGLASGNPGLQDLLGTKLVLNKTVPVERIGAVFDQMTAYLGGTGLPADEAVRTFLENLAIEELLQEVRSADRELLRAATVFEMPVPATVFDMLAAELGGSPRRLRELALLEPFDDAVDSTQEALAISRLVAARLSPLTEAEASSILPLGAKALFAAWGTAAQKGHGDAAVTLTRLALLAGDAEAAVACAPVAVTALARRDRPDAVVEFGLAAIKLLEQNRRQLSLILLATTADALMTTGDGSAATQVFEKGISQTVADAGQNTGLDVFLFQFGRYQTTQGKLDAALKAFEQLCEIERARDDAHQLAVARGQIADILFSRGELDEALRIRREEELPVYTRLGDVRSIAIAQGKIADILFSRGELDEALRIRREEELPVYTRLGDVRSIAITQGQIADILFSRGELDEALRIRREEQLPVYTRLGDVREIAIAQGKIADILFSRGELDEALRIRREEQLPVYTRLGDVRSIAITQGKIADILFSRGELDEALRIRREEELPVYTRLGDVRSIAITQGQIADILFSRGELDEALRIRREEELPVYTRLGEVRSIAITQGNIARILIQSGEFNSAKELNVARLEANRTIGDADEIASAQFDLAQIDLAQRDIESAVERLVESWTTFLHIGRAEGVAAVGDILGGILAANDATEGATAVLRLSIEAYRKLGRDVDAQRLAQILAELPCDDMSD